MARKLPLLIGLLIVVAVATLSVLLRGRDDARPAPARRAAESAGSLAPAERPEALTSAGGGVPRPELSETERVPVEGALASLPVLVLERGTHAPLAGVPLNLRTDQTAAASELSSGPDGRCRFEDLQPGDYTLTTGPHGDLDYRVDPTPVTVADAALEEVVVRVEPRWFLAGIVVEAGSGMPVRGVALMAVDAQGRLSHLATSMEDGRFRSRRSHAAGSLSVYLSQGETQGLLRTQGNGPRLLEVSVGEADVTRLTVELHWLGVLSGVVLDPDDRPIPDAEVRVLSADSIYLDNAGLRVWALLEGMGAEGRTTRSDAQGRFSLARLPDDRNLVLVANARGFASGRSPDLSPPFRESDAALELRLENGGSITGRVLDAEAAPVHAVTVTALSVDTDYQPDPTRSDEQGGFRLQGLKPGPTEVSAMAFGEGGRRHAIASGEVVVLAGEEVELVLRAGADGVHLAGVAVDQFGQVITEERLRLTLRAQPLEPLPGEPPWGSDSPLASDGTFNVTVAREGGYRLTLLGGMAGELWESQDVQAPALGLRLAYTVVPTSVLTVRALDALSGQPIHDGGISMSWATGSLGMDFSGGERSTPIREGLYTLSVDALGYAPRSRQLDLRGRLEPETLVEMRLDRGRRLSGIVLDAAGQPLKGSTLVLRVGGMLQLENLVYSGVDGRFVIESAPTAEGSVCVIDSAYRTLAEAEIGTAEVVLKIAAD